MSKTILITGGSRGIGRETARLCGARGWSVLLTYAGNTAAAEEAVKVVEQAGGRARALQSDVTREADVIAAFDAAAEAFGPIHGVVNNAGIVAPKSAVAEMDIERMRRVFDTNVLGAYLVAREAARRMPRDRGGEGGSIVNVSSRAAVLGSAGEYVDYAGSKGAVDTLTVGLANELAPGGVRANAVRPGLIETDIHASGGQPGRAERLGRLTPLGRSGTAAEVAEAIVWLLSDAASYVTGTFVDVSGGR